MDFTSSHDPSPPPPYSHNEGPSVAQSRPGANSETPNWPVLFIMIMMMMIMIHPSTRLGYKLEFRHSMVLGFAGGLGFRA